MFSVIAKYVIFKTKSNFTVLSTEIPITNCLQFLLLPREWEYLSDDLDAYSPQRYKQIRDKQRTKVYYCFNSKGDNFNAKQLLNAAKN